MAVQESFFWIMDLSQPDPWILPIAAGITTFISFTQTQSQTAGMGDSANAMAPMMKIMKYFFPITIVWMGRSFPAGLAMYWFIGQLVQILINVRLNRMRKKMREGTKKK
ncbi:MAG: YidC/Oxa1 family membrane protein insertase, partial [Anaerovorax sp.]